MRVVISTFGVRGDVQPYLALAVGLQAAGHRATLATSDNFTERLAEAIRTSLTVPAMRARAAALGEKIRAEDGVARAVELMERVASTTARASTPPAQASGPHVS